MSGNLIQTNSMQIPLQDKSIQLCAFSPPYWSLRSYKIDPVVFGGNPECEHEWGNKITSAGRGHPGKKTTLVGTQTAEHSKEAITQGQFCQKCGAWRGQLGLEPSIDLFLDHMMLVMGEVWRVLRDDGVCFCNIGDSFAGSGGTHKENNKNPGISKSFERNGVSCADIKKETDIKPKSLCLIPQKFAIRCQEAGWIVRSEIIWHKPNPMPESCKDRPTKAHEQVWMLTKQGRYFWDQEAVREKNKPESIKRAEYGFQGLPKSWTNKECPISGGKEVNININPAGRNIRSVWPLSTESTPEAHFATFPSKLVEIMARAGSSPKACEVCGAPWERIVEKTFVPQEDISLERGVRCCLGQKPMDEQNMWGGSRRGSNRTKTLNWQSTCKCDNKGLGKCVVADIFSGTGTTVLVAEKLGRTGIGLDLSSEYLWNIAKEKIEAPMQKEIF